MTPERWRRIDELFDGALKLDPAARESWLGRECGDDEKLRAEVGRLLAGDERAERDRVLRLPEGYARGPGPRTNERPDADRLAEVDQHPADEDAGQDRFLEVSTGSVTPPHPVAEGPGVAIGSYKLLQRLGEEGMGIVYLAEQERPVRRRVALKIIKPGMDTEQVIARFEGPPCDANAPRRRIYCLSVHLIPARSAMPSDWL
jgi:hypothetical protein